MEQQATRARRGSVAIAARANQLPSRSRSHSDADWAGIPKDVRQAVLARTRQRVVPQTQSSGTMFTATPAPVSHSGQLDLLPFSTSDLRYAPNVRFVVPCLCGDIGAGLFKAVNRSRSSTLTRAVRASTRALLAPLTEKPAKSSREEKAALRARLNLPLQHPAMDSAFAASHIVSERLLCSVTAQVYYNCLHLCLLVLLGLKWFSHSE